MNIKNNFDLDKNMKYEDLLSSCAPCTGHLHPWRCETLTMKLRNWTQITYQIEILVGTKIGDWKMEEEHSTLQKVMRC